MTNAHKYNHDSHETRIALLEQSIGYIGQALLRMESKIDKIDGRLWQVTFLIASSVAGLIISKIFGWI